MRDNLMERWHEIQRGEEEPSLKELQEMKQECMKTLNLIGHGGRIQTIKSRERLLKMIDRYIQEKYEWSKL